jgi:hypothetical protein
MTDTVGGIPLVVSDTVHEINQSVHIYLEGGCDECRLMSSDRVYMELPSNEMKQRSYEEVKLVTLQRTSEA